MGRAGLSNHRANDGGHPGFHFDGGYHRFSEDFLNREFQFRNPFDIFTEFMRTFGMDEDFGSFIEFFSFVFH